jgi:hypothetical protein
MLWNNYKNYLYNTLDMKVIHSSEHTNKDSKLESKLYTGEYILKSRETYVESGETEYIYNNIIYPKTGKNLPCLGIDLMAFMEKKVIIVFDFQHPVENYDFNDSVVEKKLKEYQGITKDIRFFQPGNHFSRYIYVKKCTINEIDDYLDDFKKYVDTYVELLDTYKPTEQVESDFVNFDTYMHELDPVIGFMEIRFGKEFAKDYVNNFLFSYANIDR